MVKVFVKEYKAPPYNEKEILRYAGDNTASYERKELIDGCIAEAESKLVYKVCYALFPIKETLEGLDLCFTKTDSKDLKKNLEGAEGIILFCATVGMGIDRLIEKYGVVSPVKSLIFHAIGAERIESLCETFVSDMKRLALNGLKPRFSAGFGDFPLSFQKDIFAVLNCGKNVGVCLNESLLMSPSKSVTAVIGVKTGSGLF